MSATAALPLLRQELRLERGAPLPSGAPGWILFDPLRHVFFQLGSLEQRVANWWRLGNGSAVQAALVEEGAHPEDAAAAITAFHDFAVANALVRDARTPALEARRVHARRDWWKWLLDHYLFIRVPLVRPAEFLARTLPTVSAIWSRAGIALLATLALIGLWLVTRQWDSFTAGFAGLMTPQGLAAWGAALFVVKIFHELGHAYVATRHGVRVPTMGVSFLVMMPVLYTDTSAAWRLRSRGQRMRIDAAGLLAEFSVAAVALFLWSFLPDGLLRTSAFVLATTSLATSLLVNASPFMRFDGYYILSDLLGVPNLAPRAFALARWRLRTLLFDTREPPPEDLPDRLRRAMLAYAVVTIAYRTILYVGIALLVYHAFFKALGVALFLVEVYVFLLRPVVSELKVWRERGATLFATRRARWTLGIAAGAVVLALLPLDRSISAPAILAPIGVAPATTGEPALVERVLVRNGQQVTAGQPLLILSSADLTLAIAQTKMRIAQAEARLAGGVADADDLADTGIVRRDLLRERDALAGLETRRAALTVRAGTEGRVVDLADALRPGTWTDGRRALLRVVTPARYDVQAFLPEDASWRMQVGATGRFVPDDAAAGSWRVRLDEVGAVAVAEVPPTLATTAGGPIATSGREGTRPTHALVALRLVAESADADAFVQPARGQVVIRARGDSLAAGIARQVSRVFAREVSYQ